MNTTAEIYLWGTRVGIIHQELDKSYASFEYDEEFLKSKAFFRSSGFGCRFAAG